MRSRIETAKHFIIAIITATLLILCGTPGYMAIEGWRALDALYMTVITLATVGYGEVHPVSDAGHIYTIVLIITGVGFFLYVAGAVIQIMVEGRVRILMGRRRLDRKLARLKEHYIVCGFGRIGKVICHKLAREDLDLVIIDKNLELAPTLDNLGFMYVSDDATDEVTLLKAGIKKSAGIDRCIGHRYGERLSGSQRPPVGPRSAYHCPCRKRGCQGKAYSIRQNETIVSAIKQADAACFMRVKQTAFSCH